MRNNLNDYWELTHITQAEWTTIRDACEKRLKKRRYVNKRLGDSNCKYDLIGKYDEDILKITNRRLISPSKNDFSETISSYIEAMPFEQRKSIVEYVIAPDKGGSCVIKWAKNNEENASLRSPRPKKKNISQGEFRKKPLIIELTFYANLQRVHQLILDLLGANLFSRGTDNEWQLNGISARYEKPNYPSVYGLSQKKRECPDDEYPKNR